MPKPGFKVVTISEAGYSKAFALKRVLGVASVAAVVERLVSDRVKRVSV